MTNKISRQIWLSSGAHQRQSKAPDGRLDTAVHLPIAILASRD